MSRPVRLETTPAPSLMGRVPPYSLIGRKLGAIYDLPGGCGEAIDALVHKIAQKVS